MKSSTLCLAQGRYSKCSILDGLLRHIFFLGGWGGSRGGSRVLKWGVNYLKKSENQYYFEQYLRDEKKKKEGGSEKGGGGYLLIHIFCFKKYTDFVGLHISK